MKRLTYEMINSSENMITGKGEIRICCPFCADNKYHLYINPGRGLFICFKCGEKGVVEKTSEPNLIEWDQMTKYPPKNLFVPVNVSSTDMMKQVKNLPYNSNAWSISRAHTGYLYLRDRGLSEDEMKQYDIRISIEKNGSYQDTIIFPIPIYRNRKLKYFVCRKWTDSQPKYINAPWPKLDTLYLTEDSGFAFFIGVIVEGVLDALAIGRAGYRGIGLLGKKATGQQLLSLKQIQYAKGYGYAIYLDEDAFGHAIELKLQLMAMGIRSEIIQHKKDAAQLAVDNMEELKELLSNASQSINTIKKSQM